ncbi:MAG: chorismate synthase [Oscillospiraceae bacterium]|nr:chorismate synthase [Oscillospiraceae bacterium]MBQ5338454.1 chorismate synthase [Oscillospiraceae bacterium]MBQ9906473.1 chorismate synthase [Oscillospiraceae bacterium]MBR5363857.1 chorismate synthase [Oscillospiraceae bacterium]
MASIWNHRISISLFGEAEGPAIGVVLDNIPPGEYVDIEELARFMTRRTRSVFLPDDPAHQREQLDFPQVLSGLINNRTTGSPLCAFLNNPRGMQQVDYQELSHLARPGHADYTGAMRYRGFADVRSGGHLSERMTIPLCFAGAVCQQMLERRGIYVGAQITSVHNIKDKPLSPTEVTRDELLAIRHRRFPVNNPAQGKKMLADIQNAAAGGETLGGTISCYAVNVPAGIGSPIFEGLENSIAQLVFGIPGVRGLEFGDGFRTAKMTGSQCNDPFYVDEHGHVKTQSNHHGGILGGISSGMPICFNVAIKPTASIGKPQATVDYSAMTNEVLQSAEVSHPCLVPEAVPSIEAAMSIALVSHMLDYPNFI